MKKPMRLLLRPCLELLFHCSLLILLCGSLPKKVFDYEEMQFVTSPYRMVFMAGLFVGSLGAVMDVAITMSSSIFGLYEKNQPYFDKST